MRCRCETLPADFTVSPLSHARACPLYGEDANLTEVESLAFAWRRGWEDRDDHDPNGAVFTPEDAAPGENINPYEAESDE